MDAVSAGTGIACVEFGDSCVGFGVLCVFMGELCRCYAVGVSRALWGHSVGLGSGENSSN